MAEFKRDLTGATQLEIGAQEVATTPDGQKIGAMLVALSASNITDADAIPGKLVGPNVTDGAGTLEASFERDASGNSALRIVDAAPAAYDETTNTLRAQHTIAGIESVELAATDTIAANGSKAYNLNPLKAMAVTVSIRETGGTAHNNKVVLGWYDSTGYIGEVTMLANASRSVGQSDKIVVLNPNAQLVVSNLDASNPHTYKITVHKFYQ